MRAVVDGKLPDGVTARISSGDHRRDPAPPAAPGYVLEYAGDAIRALSMEGRMTVCNMSIEGGARAGLVAPDEKAFEFLKGARCRRRAKPGRRDAATGKPCARTRLRISITNQAGRRQAAGRS